MEIGSPYWIIGIEEGGAHSKMRFNVDMKRESYRSRRESRTRWSFTGRLDTPTGWPKPNLSRPRLER